MNKDIYRHIRGLRAYNKLSQKYIADKLGITQSTYSRLENGKLHITFEQMEIFAREFDMDIQDLVKIGVGQSSQLV